MNPRLVRGEKTAFDHRVRQKDEWRTGAGRIVDI
jgi:hypothetical protein